MRRDLAGVGRRMTLLGLLGSALLVGGCGGGDGAGSSGTLAAATKQPSSQTGARPASARGGDGSASKRAGDAGSPQKAKAKGGSGAAHRAAAPSPSVPESQQAAAGPSEQGPSPSRGSHRGHAGSAGGGKPKGSGKGGGNSGHVVVPPTTGTNGDPYTVARQFCGDRANADLVPPEYRGDVDYLAQMYAEFFDPDHQKAAQAGCLAGLHDLGL
jgi:hypothetical protein